MLRILYLEDHLLLREALGSLLERSEEFRIVAQASSAAEGLDLLEGLSPDVVLADISLTDHDGLWFAREVRRRGNQVPILMLTMHEDDRHVAESFQAGVNGYLVKTATHEEMMQALRTVCQGETYVYPKLAARLGRQDKLLSKREREILTLAAEGRSNVQIAKELFLSLSTVKTHLQSAFRKLNANDRTQAILQAIELDELPGITYRPRS